MVKFKVMGFSVKSKRMPNLLSKETKIFLALAMEICGLDFLYVV